MTTFDEIYNNLFEVMKTVYAKDDFAVEHGPMFFIISNDGVMVPVVIAGGFPSKGIAAHLHVELARNPNHAMVILIDEAWRTKLINDKAVFDDLLAGRTKVANTEGSQEGVMVSMRNASDQRVGWIGIDRKAKTLTLDPLINPNDGLTTGTFIDGHERRH